VHLIKSIWGNIYEFFEEAPEDATLQAESEQQFIILKYLNNNVWPVSILLKKSARHNNISVVKSTIKNFLKQPINLENYTDLVYEHLVPILN
jgi:hypothetical protein